MTEPAAQAEDLVALAIDYATKYHIKVIPVVDKRPPFADWLNVASDDPEKIIQLFASRSSATGVGLVPGTGGYVVFDVDDKCDKEDCSKPGRHGSHGTDELAEFEKAHGALPRTAVARTPSGGRHLWFKKPEGATYGNCSAFHSIDVRADKGQVVARRWEVPLSEASPIPGSLTETLRYAGESKWTEVTKEDIDTVGREAFAFLRKQGCWGARKKIQAQNDRGEPVFGFTIQMSRSRNPGEPWHESVSIGWKGTNIFHVLTPNISYLPGKHLLNAETYDMAQISAMLAGGRDPHVTKSVTVEQRGELLTPDQILVLAKTPPKWLIKGWIEEGQTVDLFADWGTGKSFLAIDWMLHLAAGMNWQGCRIKRQVNGIYVVGEGLQGWYKRIAAWKQEHSELPNNWAAWSRPINIFRQEEVKQLAEATKYLNPGLFIFDTWSTCTAGADGNADKDVKIAVNNLSILKETGAAILILNHPGHAVKDRSKGSSVLHGVVDMTIKLATLSDRNDPRLILSNDKNRDNEKSADFPLLRRKVYLDGIVDEDGEEISTCVIDSRDTQGEEATAQLVLPPNEQKVLETIGRLWGASGIVGGIQSSAIAIKAQEDWGWKYPKQAREAITSLGRKGYLTSEKRGREVFYKPVDTRMVVNFSAREANA